MGAERGFFGCSNKRPEVVKMTCEKCGSTVFFVDETVTHVQVDGEIVKTFQGDLTNACCVRYLGDPAANRASSE